MEVGLLGNFMTIFFRVDTTLKIGIGYVMRCLALAIETAREGGCQNLAILRCVSSYPAPASDYNLQTIIDMKKK